MGFWTGLLMGLFIGAMIGAVGLGILAGGKCKPDKEIDGIGF
jgi:hypothetical protein